MNNSFVDLPANLSSFEDKYAGERAIIIGNGPSLNETPLIKLDEEYTFAMNRINLIFDKTEWRPTFYTCTTTSATQSEYREDYLDVMSLDIPSFVWDELKNEFPPKHNRYYLRCTQGEGRYHDGSIDEAPLNWWSDNIVERVSKFGSTMLVAYQIAFYMGFDRIYLVGCDLGHQKPGLISRVFGKFSEFVDTKFKKIITDPNHFDSAYGGITSDPDVINKRLRTMHDLARRASQHRDTEIYNATVGGNLEMFPRVDIEKVI